MQVEVSHQRDGWERVYLRGQGNEEYGLPGNDPNGVTPRPADP
jgi:hypothetical protein